MLDEVEALVKGDYDRQLGAAGQLAVVVDRFDFRFGDDLLLERGERRSAVLLGQLAADRLLVADLGKNRRAHRDRIAGYGRTGDLELPAVGGPQLREPSVLEQARAGKSHVGGETVVPAAREPEAGVELDDVGAFEAIGGVEHGRPRALGGDDGHLPMPSESCIQPLIQ